MAKAKTSKTARRIPTPQEFRVMRRKRNFAVLGGIIVLCVVFYAITVMRLSGAS